MKKTMPPMSGIQASAAAMLDGSPVPFGESDKGGGGGSSAMVYLHKSKGVLSMRKPLRTRGFSFHTGKRQYRLVVISTEVCAGQSSYPVLIGSGLLEEIGELLKQKLPPSRCAIVS